MIRRFFSRFLSWIGFAWLVTLVLIVLVILTMPLFPIFRDTELQLTIKNNSSRPVSVEIKIFDMDTNKTRREKLSGLKNIEPNTARNEKIYLDGWAPDGCDKIIVMSESKEKSYPCSTKPVDKDSRVVSLEIIHSDL